MDQRQALIEQAKGEEEEYAFDQVNEEREADRDQKKMQIYFEEVTGKVFQVRECEQNAIENDEENGVFENALELLRTLVHQFPGKISRKSRTDARFGLQ